MTQSDIRNITVDLPASELDKAMRYTGEAASQTLLVSLESFNRKHAYEQFADAYGSLKGTNFSINVAALREDPSE